MNWSTSATPFCPRRFGKSCWVSPRHPDMGYGYLIEFKYLKRGEKLDPARAADAGRQALDQLRGYLADASLQRHPGVRHTGLALVFHGWELVWSEAVAPP